jgi:hypothetical protein
MQKIDCRFFKFEDRVFDKIQSVHCEIQYGPIKSLGRGDSFSLEVAKTKAFGEAIERIPLKSQAPGFRELHEPKNSNGLAFHLNKEDSITKAQAELIERELVIRAWAFNEKVQVLKFEDSMTKDPSLLQVINQLKFDTQKSIQVLYFGEALGFHVVSLTIQSVKLPFNFFGYAANKDLSAAIEKASLESIILLESYLKTQTAKTDIDNIFAGNKNRFLENYNYYASNQLSLNEIFPGSQKVNSITPYLQDMEADDFENLTFNLNNIGIIGYISRSINKNFHDFSAGPLTKSLGHRKMGEVHPVA